MSGVGGGVEVVVDKSGFRTKSIKLTELNYPETLWKQLMTNAVKSSTRRVNISHQEVRLLTWTKTSH